MKLMSNVRNIFKFLDERGSVLVYMIFLMPVFIGMAALAIDVGFKTASKAQQENVAAAAALACQSAIGDDLMAGLGTHANAIQRAKDYAAKSNNKVMNTTVTLQDANILIGAWGNGTFTYPSPNGVMDDACQVTVAAPAPSFFGKLFGLGNSTIASVATATYGGSSKSLNLAMAQDITGSFSAELPQAIAADQTLLDCVYKNKKDSTNVAFNVFAYNSQTLTPLQAIGNDTAALGNYTATKNAIASATTAPSSDINGSQNQTNIMTAIAAAAKQLKDKNATGAQNSIVILTDGEANMRTPVPPAPLGNYTAGAYSTYPKDALPSDAPAPPTPSPPAYYSGYTGQGNNKVYFADAWQAYWENYWGDNSGNTTGYWDQAGKNYCTNGQTCALKASQAACAAGYKIYAIYYNSGNGNTSNVKALTCDPTLPDNQYFFNSPAAADLSAKAQKICMDSLPNTLVYQK